MYVRNYRYALENIEALLETIIKEWRQGKRSDLAKRCVYVVGAPGMGKTELLRWVSQKPGGLYLDLEERKDFSNKDAFTRKQKENFGTFFQKKDRQNGIICIDHVPDNADEFLQNFYQEVLENVLFKNRNLLFLALRDDAGFDIGSEIPLPRTEEVELRGFKGEKITKWLRGFRNRENSSYCKSYKIEFQDSKEHWPKMVNACCQKDISHNTVEETLSYWLRRKADEPSANEMKKTIRIALALHTVDNLNDEERVRKKLGAQGMKVSPWKARMKLLQAGWWQHETSEEEQRQGGWALPVRDVLQVLAGMQNKGTGSLRNRM